MDSVYVKVILILSAFGLFLFFINKALRKWLNIEKKSIFSNGHVNDQHKKIDWTIRMIFVGLFLISLFIHVMRAPLEPIWFLQAHILLFVYIVAAETARVIMEKKYAENRNDYLFSAVQLVVISLFLFSMFMTDFFGLFEG